MDLDAIRSFLVLADELHFGHASARIGITQPALSYQIRRLEKDLGVVLFNRTSRQVSLTPAGATLVGSARKILADVERAERLCHDAARGRGGQLALGSIGAALNSIVPPLVRQLRGQLPGIAVELTQMDTPIQLGALRDGQIDIGIVRSAPEVADIQLTNLVAEPMVAVVPESHRLASCGVIDVAELAREAFVLWPRAVSESFHDQVIGVCQRAGFSPHVAMEGTDIETQLGLVSAGIGVSLQPAGFRALRRVGVRFIELAPPVPTSWLQLAWLRSELSSNAGVFVDLALRLAGDSPDWARLG